VARFVLTNITLIDDQLAAGVISRSATTQATDFVAITRVVPLSGPFGVGGQSERADHDHTRATEVFQAAGLENVTTLTTPDSGDTGGWVDLTVTGRSFAPGSPVYLAVTSDTAVLASGVVDSEGEFSLSATVSLASLGAGEHRIRVVGVHSLPGGASSDSGTYHISDTVRERIESLDRGTQTLLAIVSTNPDQDAHVVLRIIPLTPLTPWWTLGLIFFVFGIAVVVVRRVTRGKLLAVLTIPMSALPAIVLGWQSTVTVFIVWAIALTAVLTAVAGAVRPGGGPRTEHASL
jgi:hypothetical protein